MVAAALKALSEGTGPVPTSSVTVSCDVELLPLVNPREPNSESPFCGRAFHPFLLDVLSSHLPRSAASKLLVHDTSTPQSTSGTVVVRLFGF